MKLSTQALLATTLLVALQSQSVVDAFVNQQKGMLTSTTYGTSSSTLRQAAPKRLEENVDGVIYVNEKCINCAACANFAPSVFRRADSDYAHVVHHQPSNQAEIMDARAAMAACPVAAIRTETLAQRRHRSTDKQSVEDLWSEQDETLVKQMALSPKVNQLELPFPRPFLYHAAATSSQNNKNNNIQNVYNIGHHNDASFGATPYLVQAKVQGKSVWIMVDTPRFSKSAVAAVQSITGPDEGPAYLFLTHVDDTAHHDQWAAEFSTLKRIFHAGDTGRHNWRRDEELNNVEIMLPSQPPSIISDDSNNEGVPQLNAYNLHDGTPVTTSSWHDDFLKDPQNDVVILHTPGHSPGSITLWKKPTRDDGGNTSQPGIIFTGDHYAYTTRTGRMSGFPRYGNNLPLQAKSLQGLLPLEWDVVAPGHGFPRDYSQEDTKEELKRREMEQALMDLHK